MLQQEEIKRAALAVGFDDCGVAPADALTDDEYPLRQWIARGWHGDLAYMERHADKRMDPRLLLPGARSVICCVSKYTPPDDGEAASHGGVAAYARSRDYHVDIKQMLRALCERLGLPEEGGAVKLCCDTVPIADKYWAARAGLGFIGRHTLLVTPRWGTWVNLGEIVTTMEVVVKEELGMRNEELCVAAANSSFLTPHSSFCDGCGRCVRACPNGAIAPDGPPMIDVRRCIAYYTTHNPRPIPPDLDTRGYTLGCDLCQLACPHNHRPLSR